MTRFLLVNTDYPAFLDALYAAHPGLEQEPYAQQLAIRNESLFGISDFYPRRLNELGHPAIEIFINNRRMQQAWCREHGVQIAFGARPHFVLRRGVVPWVVRDQTDWMGAILRAQVEEFRPDVILTHSLSDLPGQFWKELRDPSRRLIGQIASPLADDIDLTPFDLLLSSLPNFVERFREAGIRAELYRLAFDPSVLEKLGSADIDDACPLDVSFVGGLSAHHGSRLNWLERLCREVPIQVWGQGIDELPQGSPIRRAYRGPAWGIDMFRILRRSRISVNCHIDLSGKYANNMRLYETTGVGSLLLTDWKENLAEMFDPEIEAATYRTPEECVERIRYYLSHEVERAAIARAGQQRTVRDHTYRQRMAELVALVERL